MSERANPDIGVQSDEDGRVLRSLRSRERILDALRHLVGEGVLQPTAQQIASHAGVSLRTVFRQFEDMDGLFREMQGRLQEELRPLLDRPVPAGDVELRVRELVARRAAVYEKAAPFMRSDAITRRYSLFLAEAHAQGVRELRDDLVRMLPEIADLPPERRDALELLVSFEAFERLRVDQRLGRERTRATIVDAVLALLETH